MFRLAARRNDQSGYEGTTSSWRWPCVPTPRGDAAGKEIPAGRGKRENLSIKLSRDDGKTCR